MASLLSIHIQIWQENIPDSYVFIDLSPVNKIDFKLLKSRYD